MEPKQTYFPFPVLDFFKPNKVDDIIGVKYEASFARVILKHSDLGFSKNVVYDGNRCGNVLLKIEGYDGPIGFGYDGVARVRKFDSVIVWENADVPEKKKLLRTK